MNISPSAPPVAGQPLAFALSGPSSVSVKVNDRAVSRRCRRQVHTAAAPARAGRATAGQRPAASQQTSARVDLGEPDEFEDDELEDEFGSVLEVLPPIDDDEATPWALTIAKAGDTRKAHDILAMRVAHLTFVTSFMVIMTARNKPQLKAIANIVEQMMFAEHEVNPKTKSGYADSGWILLDYGSVICHIFSEEQRDYYGLENFWSRGEKLDLTGVIMPDETVSDVEEDLDPLDDWTV